MPDVVMNGVVAPSGDPDPQKASPLARTPLEVFINMTKFISTADLGRLRMSCKAVSTSLLEFFAREFFTKKQFMAHPSSLQALVDISKHPVFSCYLKHVIICTDRYEETTVGPDAETNLLLIETRNAHSNLFSTGLLRDYLAEAFAHLPELETVDIRDFNSPTRSRDHTTTTRAWWTSYGATKLTQQIGQMPSVHGGEDSTSHWIRSALFQGTVAALSIADARPQSLEVIMRVHGLPDSAFFIPPRLETPISQMLAGLKKLHLVLLAPRGPHFSVAWDMRNIKKFLLLAPNVTWLRLNISVHHIPAPNSSTPQLDEAVKTLCWVAGLEPDGKTSLAPNTDVPSFELETLELGNFYIKLASLQGVVRRYSKTLQHLSFRRITLISTRQEDLEKINLWQGLIQSFGTLGSLRTLSLAQLKQSTRRITMPHPDDPKKRCTERTVREASGHKVAELAAGMITPEWPKPFPLPVPDMDVGDDGDDGDDDDDDNDDNDDNDDDGDDHDDDDDDDDDE